LTGQAFSLSGLVLLVALPAVVALSATLTAVVRRYALAARLLDHPNERSSHSVPTPRGGGLSIVVVCLSGTVLMALWRLLDVRLALALCVGGGAVAFVGWLDDRGQLAVRWRLAVHLAAAAWAVYLLGGLSSVQMGANLLAPGAWGYVLGVVGIVWALNLFNFMDGIDGIAASEGTFVALGCATLWYLSGASTGTCVSALILGAACCGFLIWNWPPARIFMGDVGSGFVGYTLAVLVIGAQRNVPVALHIWLVVFGLFALDATLTLLRRSLRGERIYEAHRSHAYQHLARYWGSHRRVTLLATMLNLVWLLPCAALAAVFPAWAAWILAIALLPLAAVLLAAGAGRRETPTCS